VYLSRGTIAFLSHCAFRAMQLLQEHVEGGRIQWGESRGRQKFFVLKTGSAVTN